ncbi:transposase domain-containing protein, partial [Escherichia coli]|uniref:transposase domain-containing protein n=1 Tax=Escherichia coli TaxID=562 RepID=UPI00207B619B
NRGVDNIAENALRGVAVGRKNWLFAGSDSGGEHAAVLYSLIGTCRLNNVEPEKWLRYLASRLRIKNLKSPEVLLQVYQSLVRIRGHLQGWFVYPFRYNA